MDDDEEECKFTFFKEFNDVCDDENRDCKEFPGNSIVAGFGLDENSLKCCASIEND